MTEGNALSRLLYDVLLAGALTVTTLTSGCWEINAARNESKLREQVETVNRASTSSEYATLENNVLAKMKGLYKELTGEYGSLAKYFSFAKNKVVYGEDLTKYALNIGFVLAELGIDGKLPTKALPTSEYNPGKKGTIEDLVDPECPIIAFYDSSSGTVYKNYPEKFTKHYAAHETAHGAVDDESWANYLALRGALESNDKEWQFLELYFLHLSLTVGRNSKPPEKCAGSIKTRWPQYFKNFVGLVLRDKKMRGYFGLDHKIQEE